MPASGACSSLHQERPLAGTAPHATAWIVIEQPGPWSRRAVQDGAHAAIRDLVARTAELPITVLFARQPRGRERTSRSGPRRVWVSHCSGQLLHGVVPISALAGLEVGEVAVGELSSARALGLEPDARQLLLVCGNSKRDACCARLGRPLVEELKARGHEVWECTHLGGHRFAATGVLLPEGLVLGRLDAETAEAFLNGSRAPGLVDHVRGRSALVSHAQAAELAVARELGIGPVVMDVRLGSPAEVIDPQGRAWHVQTSARPAGALPLSCAAEPETFDEIVVGHVTLATGGTSR